MSNREHCSGCIWSHECKGVYEALGRAEGPSVALKAVAAFLLPIFIFIIGLVVLDKFLAQLSVSEPVRIVIGASGSAAAVFVAMLIVSRFGERHRKDHYECQLKGTHER